MKKAQILGALALAFALGAIAPIAGVIGGASAWEVLDSDTHGKATCDDAKKVGAGMASNANYIALNNLLTDAWEANQTDSGVGVKVGAVTVNNFTALMSAGTPGSVFATYNALKTAAAGAAGENAVIGSQTVLEAIIAEYGPLNTNELTLSFIKNTIDTAKTVKGYSVMAQIIEAKEAGKTTLDQLSASTINAYNDIYTTDITAGATLITALPLYNEYKALVDSVDKLEELYTNYKNSYDKIVGSDMAAIKNLLNTTGIAAYDDIMDPVAEGTPMIPTLADAAAVVFGAVTNPTNGVAHNVNGSHVFNGGTWEKYMDAVIDLKTCNPLNPANTDTAVYDKIIAAMAIYRQVVDVPAATKNYEIAAGFINAPAEEPGTTDTPTDPGTTTPSTDGAGTTTPGTTAGAPNTGALSTAKGTATTVSIVAGLASALTALGAGVVAYRSARRSK